MLGSCCGLLSVTLSRKQNKAAKAAAEEKEKAAKKEPEKVEKLLDLDTMELEVGYGLVRLVDAAKGGDLLDRISMIRRQVAHRSGHHRPACAHPRQHAAWRQRLRRPHQGSDRRQGRGLSRAVPGDGQRRHHRSDLGRDARPPSRRSVCRLTGSPNRSGHRRSCTTTPSSKPPPSSPRISPN